MNFIAMRFILRSILQVVVVCIVSLIVSFFAKKALEVDIPCANTLVYNKTDSCGIINGSDFSITGRYTGLSGQTFKDNLYRK